MTVASLDRPIDLPKGLAQRRIKKERIIAEPTGSPQLKGDRSFAYAVKNPFQTPARSGATERHHTDKAGPSFFPRQIAQGPEQLLVVSRIIGVRAAKARRLDARGAVEGVHLQTRIISQGEIPGKLGQRPGFFPGVFLVARSVLDYLGIVLKSAQRKHLDGEIFQDRLDLREFTRIRRSHQEFHNQAG